MAQAVIDSLSVHPHEIVVRFHADDRDYDKSVIFVESLQEVYEILQKSFGLYVDKDEVFAKFTRAVIEVTANSYRHKMKLIEKL